MVRNLMTLLEPLAPSRLRNEVGAWLRCHREQFETARSDVEPLALEEVVEADLRLQHALWDAGFTRLGWPEWLGGAGGSAVLRAVVYEQIVREGFRIPLPLSTLEVLGPVMVQVAPELSRNLLGRCIRGDEVWSQGFSETEAGSDLASLSCKAERTVEGLRVSGHKTWSSFGSMAQKAAVLVRTGVSGHRGITLVLMDLTGPGCEVRPILASSNRNEFAEFFFDDVLVPYDRVVGELDSGWQVAMALLQWERGMFAWQRQAILHRLLAELSASLDSPSSSIRHSIVHAWVTLTALRSTSARTVERLAAGENPGPEISVDKVLLATAEREVHDLFRSVHPIGFALGVGELFDVIRADWFFSRMASIYGGAIEVQRSIVAERVLKLPRAARR